MKQSKKNAFSLIELIAVLVIMAIISLIVTPLVMSIIRKARISADKRSIDAYGRSIELAIAGYLMDNGSFPTKVSQLTIEYSGNQVVCETTQINTDSSVYLAGCTVNGRSVDGYTYGKEEVVTYKAYNIGDEVTYNNVDYYVIKDSGTTEDSVTLLKAEPLSAEEITTYSAGTGARTNNEGGVQYHSNSNQYETSYIKIIVDAWVDENVPTGLIEARLITLNELIDYLGYVFDEASTSAKYIPSLSTPSWVYNSTYWTMTPENDSDSSIYWILQNGGLNSGNSSSDYSYNTEWVRPVIVLPKFAL